VPTPLPQRSPPSSPTTPPSHTQKDAGSATQGFDHAGPVRVLVDEGTGLLSVKIAGLGGESDDATARVADQGASVPRGGAALEVSGGGGVVGLGVWHKGVVCGYIRARSFHPSFLLLMLKPPPSPNA